MDIVKIFKEKEMRTKLFLLSVLFFALAACDKDNDTDQMNNSYYYKNTESITIQKNIEDYIATALNVSLNENELKNSLVTEFDVSKQKILGDNQIDQSAVLIEKYVPDDEYLLFFRDGEEIEHSLIMKVLNIIEDEYIHFECFNLDSTPVFEAEFDFLSQTYTVLAVYDDDDEFLKAAVGGSWGCNLTLGTAGLIWGTAFGMVSAGAGFIVGAGWLIFQTW
ncbi:hypothetical protein LJB78_01495, partial [Bacteroidales bacterium OttesenSCG-928-J16]|nr:hypothetical protein [Bacteroidales bacterium OttesenSCG-928-J16]